ncbi:MAG: menaquinone biosynthesis protein [Phycisphaerales bacterium]|nr:menaquinone biosynthesis protein [Phycisphaerales bacterium]MCB9862581.1 menaquinone biosynthesis protein [Phycisphaerales bacterium]
MTADAQQTRIRTQSGTTRLGVVSYLNARPLYETLLGDERYTFHPAVPSALDHMLKSGDCAAALLPVVDYWRNRDSLRPVSDGCIASDGETMTVRVFARRPAEKIIRLHVDGDSHTSVILSQLIWRRLYGTKLELSPWTIDDGHGFDDAEAVLLIGDKVVTSEPAGFGFEVDLGAAWKYLTGLPFVFAAWYARSDRADDGLGVELSRARDCGVAGAAEIAKRFAPVHGWPESIARRYLCETLRFTLTPAAREGMQRFFTMATEEGLLS